MQVQVLANSAKMCFRKRRSLKKKDLLERKEAALNEKILFQECSVIFKNWVVWAQHNVISKPLWWLGFIFKAAACLLERNDIMKNYLHSRTDFSFMRTGYWGKNICFKEVMLLWSKGVWQVGMLLWKSGFLISLGRWLYLKEEASLKGMRVVYFSKYLKREYTWRYPKVLGLPYFPTIAARASQKPSLGKIVTQHFFPPEIFLLLGVCVCVCVCHSLFRRHRACRFW